MFDGQKIAVVVPCFREETQIRQVIETMPSFVDRILVVDDASPDRTADVVRECMAAHPNVELLVHPENRGVGAAIVTGYKRALNLDMDIACVMAGDGQMPPHELADIIAPVSSGEADYSKANRLAVGVASSRDAIPRKRLFGNAVLSVLTKIASGYYQIADSQTGFTAISARILRRIDLDSIFPRYGYPNDMLVHLNVARARVTDVASVPVYGVGEVSGIKIHRVIFTISWLLLRRFWWRLWALYTVRDFHPLVIFYVLGAIFLATGVAAGSVLAAYAIGENTVSGSTAVAVSVLLQSGLLMTLFAMLFDFEHNRPLMAHRRPSDVDADTVRFRPIEASLEVSTPPIEVVGAGERELAAATAPGTQDD